MTKSPKDQQFIVLHVPCHIVYSYAPCHAYSLLVYCNCNIYFFGAKTGHFGGGEGGGILHA